MRTGIGSRGGSARPFFIPQSEMHDMIIELRSLTMGVGSFGWKFDHLQELTGRLADEVVRSRAEAVH